MKLAKSEIIGGITTFLTMSYIIAVNPAILSTEGTGMAFSGVVTATVLLAFSMTLFMGLYAKLPFAVAPGMGLNAFFTFSIILTHHIPFPVALGMVFWSGFIFLLISLTPIREKIAKAIPEHLRIGVATGIGIFLTFIGLKNAGFISPDPVTFVRVGVLDFRTFLCVMGIVGAVFLIKKKNPLAYVLSISIVLVGSLFFEKINFPENLIARPDFESVFFKIDFMGALKLSLLPSIISIFFTDLFDSLSTFVGIAHANHLLDEKGEPKNLKQGLLVDAVATMIAGPLGTSAGTAYIESSSGIEMGGRTGMSSVVTAFCFLPFLFLSPLLKVIPVYATAPVLILVGCSMFKSVKGLVEKKIFERIEDLLPTFISIVLIPLTFSITQGLLWGFVTHIFLYVMVGRKKEISGWLLGVGILSMILLYIDKH